MSSPQLEEFLARLYTNAVLREQFIRDPGTVASTANLTADEFVAMCNIDVAGLKMAAVSFAYKRESYRRKSGSIFRELWKGLLIRAPWQSRNKG
ncbi:MAG: hypothetical protein ACXWJK_09740 [Burkholderiaceae bacterium]